VGLRSGGKLSERGREWEEPAIPALAGPSPQRVGGTGALGLRLEPPGYGSACGVGGGARRIPGGTQRLLEGRPELGRGLARVFVC